MKSGADKGGKPGWRTRREAKQFLDESKKLLRRNRKKISEQSRARVEAGIKALEEALAGGDKRLATALKDLDTAVTEVLGFAKKGSVREFFESISVAVGIAVFLRAFVVEAFKIPSGSMIPTLEVGDHIFVNKFIYGLRVPFTNAWFAEWGSAAHGDVIVFRYPLDESKDYIKRVVAVAGDRIRVVGREVFVNDQRLERAEGVKFEFQEDSEPGGPPRFPGWIQAVGYQEQSRGEDPARYMVLYEPMKDRGRDEFPSDRTPDLPGLECRTAAGGRSECVVQDDHLFVMGDNRDNSSDSRVWGGVHTKLVKGKAMFIWYSRGEHAGLRVDRIGQGVD